MQPKKYLRQSKEIVNAIRRNIYGNPRIRKYLRQPPGEESCSQNLPFHAKSNIWAFESCKIWFLNLSINLMLRGEKASTIRKGKLFKFCFPTDNHLIVEMGTFSHFHFCQLVAKSSFQNSSQSSMQLFWESFAWEQIIQADHRNF